MAKETPHADQCIYSGWAVGGGYGGFETQKHTRKAKKDGHKATGPGGQGPALEKGTVRADSDKDRSSRSSGVTDLISRAAA